MYFMSKVQSLKSIELNFKTGLKSNIKSLRLSHKASQPNCNDALRPNTKLICLRGEIPKSMQEQEGDLEIGWELKRSDQSLDDDCFYSHGFMLVDTVLQRRNAPLWFTLTVLICSLLLYACFET